MEQLKNKEQLYNFIFWFNPYENLWYIIDRDTQLAFFSGKREESIFFRSSKVETLVEIITKEGELEKLLAS
jgi:hypothetical protein